MSTEDNTSTSDEAKNLLKEAKEAEQQGDKDEAAFLKDAAKELDPSVKSTD